MIFIVCALHCEAKPIIERYRLVADRESAFPVFTNKVKVKGNGNGKEKEKETKKKSTESKKIILVVAGIGKLLTASAMSYVYARYNEPAYAAWFNLGVAGMKTAGLGDFFNINKVTEKISFSKFAVDSGADSNVDSIVNWYPVRLPSLSEQQSCSVITVDFPDDNYTEDDAFDMEASAFMSTALRFSPVELIQLVKIISDNESNAMQDVNKLQVTELVSKQLSQIDDVVKSLLDSVELFENNYDEHDLYEQCVKKWSFSEYQKKQLVRVLQQWQALDDNASIDNLEIFHSGKQMMAYLSERLSSDAVEFR